MKNKTVRGIVIASLAAILCITTALLVIFCEPKHPIEKFAYKIMKKQNFQMDVSISKIPFLGGMAFSLEMDGEIIHIPDIGSTEECYVETIGDDHYTYSKDQNGVWTKEKNEDDTIYDFLDKEDLQELINSDNYDLVEGTENVYRQKADVQFENFKNVTITLKDDSCIIEAIALYNDWALETQIVISKVGEISLTLPKVG